MSGRVLVRQSSATLNIPVEMHGDQITQSGQSALTKASSMTPDELADLAAQSSDQTKTSTEKKKLSHGHSVIITTTEVPLNMGEKMTAEEKFAQTAVEKAVEDIKKVVEQPIFLGRGSIDRKPSADDGQDPTPMPIHPGDPIPEPVPEKGIIIRERRITEERDGFNNIEIYIEKWVDGVLTESKLKIDRTDLVFPGEDEGTVIVPKSIIGKHEDAVHNIKEPGHKTSATSGTDKNSTVTNKKSPQPNKVGTVKKSPEVAKTLKKSPEIKKPAVPTRKSPDASKNMGSARKSPEIKIPARNSPDASRKFADPPKITIPPRKSPEPSKTALSGKKSPDTKSPEPKKLVPIVTSPQTRIH